MNAAWPARRYMRPCRALNHLRISREALPCICDQQFQPPFIGVLSTRFG
jgi:hypothetical protein